VTILAWHFLAAPDRLAHTGAPLVVGEWQVHDGPVTLCSSGLHASMRSIDALKHAPGQYVGLVECDGEIVEESDKIACSRRRHLWVADATEVLRLFARTAALDVAHLWTPPEIVTKSRTSGIIVPALAACRPS
jgi:hypothetical protein